MNKKVNERKLQIKELQKQQTFKRLIRLKEKFI